MANLFIDSSYLVVVKDVVSIFIYLYPKQQLPLATVSIIHIVPLYEIMGPFTSSLTLMISK
jgi:hypothetical protein